MCGIYLARVDVYHDWQARPAETGYPPPDYG